MTEQELYKKLSELQLRTQYVRVTLLDFYDHPIKEINGFIQSGSMSVNGSSAVRRTINLSMLVTKDNVDIENINNEISINKKVKIEIGYDNPFYQDTGERIQWFKCGIYILTSASTSRSTSGYTISLSGKDKMCMLDGSCGGTLHSAVVFHEREVELEDGSKVIEYPTIFQIIFEAVNHWGGEEPDKIIISDIDDQVRKLVKNDGSKIIYFDPNYTALHFSPAENYIPVAPGDDAGYELTDFTYPGELTLKPGDTVVTLLDKIKNTLGNFEYFYDLDGNFVFQEIKNYLNTGSPLLEYDENSVQSKITADNYVRNYNNAKYLYSLTNLDSTTQITRNPKWADLKNDFCVWGERKSAAGSSFAIRYHLVIDKKPEINLANKYMWLVKDEKSKLKMRYEFTETEAEGKAKGWEEPVSPPCPPESGYEALWREELYRAAINAQVVNSVYGPYDAEFIAEWRKLYNPDTKKYGTESHGWNPDVFTNPKALDYWIDFIDSDGPLGCYSVSQIGRRTKVVSNNNLQSVYNNAPPDIIFIKAEEATAKLLQNFEITGQKYFQLDDQTYNLFSISTTGASCFDEIRELLYQNLCYNTTIQITCLPKYYMEPNNIIYIRDDASGINGNYLVTQFTLPLAYNGTMSITATEVLTRV